MKVTVIGTGYVGLVKGACFAEEIIELTNTEQEILFKELPEDDPSQRQPDISKAKEILKWSTRTEDLKKTYEAFQKLSKDDLNKQEHRDFRNFRKK